MEARATTFKTAQGTRKGFVPVFESEDEYFELSEGDAGFCVWCGEEAYGVEPDARKYQCESCKCDGVYGLQELVIMNLVRFTEPA